MPFIIYSGSKAHGIIDFNTADAVKYYIRHYQNWLILCDIYNRTTNKVERRQANTEVRIADRKMEFWRRHKNFDPFRAAREMAPIRLDRANRHINLE